MPLSDAELKKVLLAQSYLSAADISKAEEVAKERTTPLKTALFDLGLLTQNLYEGAVAEYYHLEHYDPQSAPPKVDVLLHLPEKIARLFSAIVVGREGGGVTVATADPSNPLLEKALRLNLGREDALLPEGGGEGSAKQKKGEGRPQYRGRLQYLYASQATVDALLARYRKPLATRFQTIIDAHKRVAPEILEEIFSDAVELRASDIHFEPQEKVVIVRFRVDGVMHEAGRIPKEYYEGVLNRIKIAANMRIDEHFSAQDGAIRYERGGSTMDVRVSVVPIVDGEKVALRLLSEYVRTLTLNDLGFSDDQKGAMESAAHKPFGMILATGPTGAGKSTTLYGLMKLRNFPDVNISTIEDPVEYKVPGINHIQVNAETGLTFATGLRALVRQDPDIILVGEIRDGETASIAVNAALTGHLLFSTVHANDAATTIPRLLDMGVEPFLLASTLEVVVGQRLVRRVCPQCRYSEHFSGGQLCTLLPHASHYMGSGGARLYRGKGCETCSGTGYRGRVGIFEILTVTPDIEALIVARAPSSELNKCAKQQGMKTLFEDGLRKVLAGLTTLEELLRVAAPSDVPLHSHGSTNRAPPPKAKSRK